MPTVTAVKVPYGVYWKKVTDYIMEKYVLHTPNLIHLISTANKPPKKLILFFDIVCRHNIEVSGGLGPTVGEVWRIGLMGHNSSATNVQLLLKVLAEALRHDERLRARL